MEIEPGFIEQKPLDAEEYLATLGMTDRWKTEIGKVRTEALIVPVLPYSFALTTARRDLEERGILFS